jgi:hypothetical protein
MTAMNPSVKCGLVPEGGALAIRPERSLPVKRIMDDPVFLRETCGIGRRAAERRLEQTRDFIHAGPAGMKRNN